jgi:hypothetical protein
MLLHEFDVQGYKIKVQDSLKDINLTSDWKKLSQTAQHLRPEMLQLLENAKPLDLQFRYLFIYSGDSAHEPCGIIYLQLLHFNHRNFNFTQKNLLHYFALGILRFTSFRVLLAGCLFSVDFSPLAYDQEKIKPELFIAILEAYSDLEKYDILVLKDLPAQFNKTNLAEYNYSPFETDLTMQLEINPLWKNFKGYEIALTHKYAQRVRKIRKQGSEIIRKEIRSVDFNKYRKQIHRLFLQVSGKQTIRMGIIDDVYFEELYKTLGNDFFITGYFKDEELIAFASHILYQHKLEVHYIGIDYKYNKDFALYFNILYDGIELAMLYSKNSLELGRTAREAKAVVGCHPIYFNDYLKVRNRFIRWMLNLLSKYFDQGLGEGWKKRHPFKTIATSID